jgi:hypothetical protein
MTAKQLARQELTATTLSSSSTTQPLILKTADKLLK